MAKQQRATTEILGNILGLGKSDEAAAPETTATKEAVLAAASTEEKKLGRPPKEPTMPLTVRLSPELLHELKLRAVMEHTTQTAIIDTLLRKYLNM